MIDLNQPPESVVKFRETVFDTILAQPDPLSKAKKMLELYKEEYELWLSAYPDRVNEVKKLFPDHAKKFTMFKKSR